MYHGQAKLVRATPLCRRLRVASCPWSVVSSPLSLVTLSLSAASGPPSVFVAGRKSQVARR